MIWIELKHACGKGIWWRRLNESGRDSDAQIGSHTTVRWFRSMTYLWPGQTFDILFMTWYPITGVVIKMVAKWLKSILYYDQNGWKTIPFGAAHTCIASMGVLPPFQDVHMWWSAICKDVARTWHRWSESAGTMLHWKQLSFKDHRLFFSRKIIVLTARRIIYIPKSASCLGR